MALILECLPDFTSLLSVIESCRLPYYAYEIRSDTIVSAIFERSCVPVIREYAALPSRTRKRCGEYIRKKLRSTYKSPIGLGLIIQRNITLKSTIIAILRRSYDAGLHRFLHHSYCEILRRMIVIDTASSSSIPDFSRGDIMVLMEVSRVIERLAYGYGREGPEGPTLAIQGQ